MATLPELVSLGDLPALAGGRPTVGIADDDLGPVGFRADGVFLISGPPASGRTTAVGTFITAAARARPDQACVFLGSKRSPLITLGLWQQVATSAEEIAEAAAKLEQTAGRDDSPRLAVVIEGLADFLGGPADMPLTAMIKALARHGRS